jgi:hypothetical protein
MMWINLFQSGESMQRRSNKDDLKINDLVIPLFCKDIKPVRYARGPCTTHGDRSTPRHANLNMEKATNCLLLG